MSEVEDILRAAEALQDAAGETAALATLVAVEGSTYRRAGARLLVPAEGQPVGNISGGCLEQDIEEAAREVIAAGRPRLLRFDLTGDDEALWGWGLGCNGIVKVLVEPLRSAAPLLEALQRTLEAGPDDPAAGATVAVTWVEGNEAGRRVFYPESTDLDAPPESALDSDLRAAAQQALEAGRGRCLAFGGNGEAVEGEREGPASTVYLDVLEPPPHLVVCGGGLDAAPLVSLAAGLGWSVDVVDHRSAPLTAERFPGARHRILAETPEALATRVSVGDRSYVVVMSHNYLRDRDYLAAFLPSAAPYLAMLGPRQRLERLLKETLPELQGNGGPFHGLSPQALDHRLGRLHGPAGLDLGGDGPEQVAWSILAEILAVKNDRQGGFLRERRSSIHGADGALSPAPPSP